jgi:hypothetical protein
MATQIKAAPKTAWPAGKSGNPKGKPKGSGAVQKLRMQISSALPEIIKKVSDAALAGDIQAARLILERVIPPVKAIEQTQALNIPIGGTLTDQGRGVLAAIAAGDISPGQGAQLIAAIGSLARVADMDEMSKRLTKLEERQK